MKDKVTDRDEKRNAMTFVIKQSLSEYPELLRDALDAISIGINDSILNLNKKLQSLDVAFLSSLSIIKNDRSKKLDNFCSKIVLEKLIEYGGTSEIERIVIEQLKEKTKDD